MMLPCVLLLAAFVAHCQATITVFKPKTNDEWKYDDNNVLESGLVVQWTSDRGSAMLVTIELWDEVSFGADTKLATLTSGSGTSNANEPGQTYAEYLVPSGIKLSSIPVVNPKPYVYIYVPCSGFLCSSDKINIYIKLTPTNPCRVKTCIAHSTCQVVAGVLAVCNCDAGYYNPRDITEDVCVTCATRPPCPLKSTCDPTSAICECDRGYYRAVGGGCEITLSPSPPAANPTPSSNQGTDAPAGFCPSAAYCQTVCSGPSVDINGFGPCCADCSTASGINASPGQCTNRCPAARFPTPAASPTPSPTPSDAPVIVDVGTAPAGYCPSVNYCVQRCRTYYVSINGYGSCCADCTAAPGIDSGPGRCSNRCPAAAWADVPPRPTPLPPPPTPVPVTLSGCSGLCGGCNCGRSCCASMCGGDSLIANHACVADGGQLLRNDCTCGSRVAGVMGASSMLVDAFGVACVALAVLVW